MRLVLRKPRRNLAFHYREKIGRSFYKLCDWRIEGGLLADDPKRVDCPRCLRKMAALAASLDAFGRGVGR